MVAAIEAVANVSVSCAECRDEAVDHAKLLEHVQLLQTSDKRKPEFSVDRAVKFVACGRIMWDS